MKAHAVRPAIGYEDAFLAMLRDLEQHSVASADFYAMAKVDFPAYVQGLLDEEQGVNLPEGRVPCTHRWLVDFSGAVVGVSRLRHNIDTPFLADNGGHIGYDVAPNCRGKGYGHFALRVALDEAVKLGIPRVLLYAAADNAASRAVIERGGGELESIAFSEFWHESICKYSVTLPRET